MGRHKFLFLWRYRLNWAIVCQSSLCQLMLLDKLYI